MKRFLALLAAAFCLTGCGVVTSTRPFLGPADAQGTPGLKPGLWAVVEPGCRFNTAAAAAKWPECASPLDIREGVVTDLKAKGEGGALDHPIVFILAVGDPMIIQAQMPADGPPGPADFVYAGLRALATDDSGVITRARIWPALCAKPQAKAGPGLPPRPLPGLTMLQGPAANCLARNRGALRNAVETSERWVFDEGQTSEGLTAQWVRDKDRWSLRSQ